MTRFAFLISTLLFLGLACVPLATAHASCMFFGRHPEPFTIRPPATFSHADFPPPPRLQLDRLERGYKSNSNDCAFAGELLINVDYPPAQGFGLIYQVRGAHPDSFRVPDHAVQPQDLYIRWNDTHPPNAPLDIEITATWVNSSGRLGPTSSPLHIRDSPGGVLYWLVYILLTVFFIGGLIFLARRKFYQSDQPADSPPSSASE